MPTFSRGFLVLDAHGDYAGITSDAEEAGHIAEREAGRDHAALWLATGGLPARINDTTRPEQMPAMAWRASGVPRIDLQAAMRLRPTGEVADALNELRRGQGLPPQPKSATAGMYGKYVGQNTKTAKVAYIARNGRAEIVAGCRGLSLAPARISFEQAYPGWREQRRALITDDTRGQTFCLASVKECRAACLVATGQNALPTNAEEAKRAPHDSKNYRAKIQRSLLLRQHPEAFMHILVKGFEQWLRTAQRDKIAPFGRLNVLSDLPWELICPEFFDRFPSIQFYDYTKVPGRLEHDAPPNYHLTYSWSNPRQLHWMAHELSRGRHLAVPFFHPDNRQASKQLPGGRSTFPKSFLGAPVISGDQHDLRPLDALHPAAQDGPVVVGLRFKEPLVLDVARGGKRRRTDFGAFVVDVYESQDDSGNPVWVGAQVPAYTRFGKTWILGDVASLEEKRQEFERAIVGARAAQAPTALVEQWSR